MDVFRAPARWHRLADRALARIVVLFAFGFPGRERCGKKVGSLLRMRDRSKSVFGVWTESRWRMNSVAAGDCLSRRLPSRPARPSSAQCKPNHFRAPYFIKTMGPCGFDPTTMSFQGEPAEQAKCLMRGMDQSRNLAPPVESLPPAAYRPRRHRTRPAQPRGAEHIPVQARSGMGFRRLSVDAGVARQRQRSGRADGALFRHSRHQRAEFRPPLLSRRRRWRLQDQQSRPSSNARTAGERRMSSSTVPAACCSITSCPFPGARPNSSRRRISAGALKGLFLHVELIQPRRAAGHGRRNDAQSPTPAFTTAQYDRLALLYVIASVRASRWLIPAYHAASTPIFLTATTIR